MMHIEVLRCLAKLCGGVGGGGVGWGGVGWGGGWSIAKSGANIIPIAVAALRLRKTIMNVFPDHFVRTKFPLDDFLRFTIGSCTPLLWLSIAQGDTA